MAEERERLTPEEMHERYPNLIPNSERTPEQLRAQTIAAGRASGASRRKRKTFAEGLKYLLSMQVDDAIRRDALKQLGLDGTYQDAINFAQIDKSMRGDTDAARFVRDTVGEKPRDGVEIGNLDDRPLATIDMSKLTDEQLRQLASARAEQD